MDAIAELPERERMVVALDYYEDLKLAEIGELLGVTESRASRLRAEGIRKLRPALEGNRATLVGA